MKKIFAAAAAIAAFSGTANAATIVSENFESGGFGAFTATGQVQNATGFDYQACCGTTGTPANLANNFAAFGGGNQASGTLETTFNTILGQIYTVTFDYGALGSGSENVTFNAQVGGLTVLAIADNNLNTTFKPASFFFTGTGGATTLSITSQGVANVDGIVDNINVTGAVPEPATWAMMIGGFGMIGGTMRSAKRKAKATLATA